MNKLRIGVFAWGSLYSIKVGGIAPHVSELSETLAAKGHEVHIFTRSGGLSNHEEINGVHYHGVMHDQSSSIVNEMDRMCDAMYSRFLDVRGTYGKAVQAQKECQIFMRTLNLSSMPMNKHQ